MIYVFSYEYMEINLEGFRLIHLTSPHPIKEINRQLKLMNKEDWIVMLPLGLGPHPNYLSKVVPFYKEEYRVLSFSLDDPEKNFVMLRQDKFKTSDTIIFKKGFMKTGLTDINPQSNYDRIRLKIIRQCGGGNIYTPVDRTDVPVTDIPQPLTSSFRVFYDNDASVSTSNIIGKNVRSANEVYKVRINLGIGDILFARSVLDAQSKRFDKVYISPDYNIYTDTRQPNKKEKRFTKELLELIFQPPYYHLETKRIEEYPHRFCQTFNTLDKFPLVLPQLSDVLCEGTPLNIGPYITIATRVREVPIKEYEKFVKERFLEAVLKLSNHYKIVIMGEQELANYKEHKILDGQVFTIYKDLIKTIPKDRVLDLSFKNVKNIKENRMTRFKQECLYMRDAEWNIVVGNGGNACIAATIGNAIGYFSPANPKGDYYHRMFNGTQLHTGVHYTKDITKFLEKLNDIIKPNKPVYKICVNMGIGDLLIIRGELDKAKDKFSQVHITPNVPFFNQIRSKIYTGGFIKDFIKLLFPPPYYKLTTDLKYPKRDGHGVQIFDGIPIASPHHLRDLFCVGKSLDIGPYITINSKVRMIQKRSYANFKPAFYEALNKLAEKYKLVILGDKNLPNWQEFQMFSSDIFVIYNDIINNIPKERYIDLTFDDLHKGSLKQVQQDCVYMRDAVNNIFLGAAGAWCLGLVSGKSISYYEPGVNQHWKEYATIKSNAYLTDNLNKYLYWMSEL